MAGHPNPSHKSDGLLFGSTGGGIIERMTVARCLMAHNNARNPTSQASQLAVINSVVYNPGGKIFLIRSEGANVPTAGFIGNVVIAGPDTRARQVFEQDPYPLPAGSGLFLLDNVFPSGIPLSLNPIPILSSFAYPDGLAAAMPSSATLEYVLNHAGARPRDRDTVDARIIQDVRDGTGRLINSQDDVGGWPVLAEVVRTFVPVANPNGDDDGDGYTNLEEQLIVADGQVMEPATISRVFWDLPAALVGEAVTGTAELENAEGRTVHFVVFDVGDVQVAEFDDTVEGGVAGFTWTPDDAGEFTFSAQVDGSVEYSITLVVTQPVLPPTATFTVTPQSIRRGQPATLAWNTENAHSVFLSSVGNVALDGSRTVRPQRTTTYTLTVTGLDGSVIRRSVTVRVGVTQAVVV
jgi:hypothetical protein